MIIKINNKEYEIKNTMRSILIFESITNSVFKLTTMTDMMIYFFAVLLASNDNIDFDFVKFIDYIDNDASLMQQFQGWVEQENKKNEIFQSSKKK